MKETIAQKILLDAQAESNAILDAAKAKAKSIVDQAEATNAQQTQALRQELNARCKDIAERKAALARLDGGKIALWEKHRVLDEIYQRALSLLIALGEEDSVSLIDSLLTQYAEEGDVVYLATAYPYANAVKALPVFTQKHLVLSAETKPVSGGVYLQGSKSDKDLSYEALLQNDKDTHAAALAAQLFKA